MYGTSYMGWSATGLSLQYIIDALRPNWPSTAEPAGVRSFNQKKISLNT